MLASTQMARELDGERTEVLLQAFSDRILVLVTQVGKVGNLVSLSDKSELGQCSETSGG